jgi:hypothetical protein
MYAVPARRNEKKIVLASMGCLECGRTLFFSFDEVEGENLYRYASCDNKHTIFFAASTKNAQKIESDEVGYIIDDTQPGWEKQIPAWVE